MDDKDLAEEGLEHLKALVGFDTTNPPGNEMPAVKYLDKVLRAEGFEPTIIESAPHRGNIVARLAGDGTEKPLLLLSHLDVVPAEADKWDVDPFSAEEKDGYLYGRGTLDMKQMTAMSLMALCSLKRKKVTLKRDVIFAAVADEEAGGRYGAAHLVEHHPDLIQAEFALCEMGGFRIEVRGHTYFPVQVAERGCAWCKVRYTGEPGHGSIPNPHSAINKMVRSLLRLEKKGLPFHATDIVRDFVSLVASDQKAPVKATMKALLNPLTSRMALGRMEREQARVFYAQLHSTATPTVLRAGEKENVIPAEAEVVLDGRVLPGQDWESFHKELRAVLGKDAEIELVQWTDPLVYPSDTTLFDVIRRVLTDRVPEAGVVPYLLTGYTDAKHLDKLGTITYGFSPMNNDPEEMFSKLVHGHNERIGIDAFRWGVGVLGEVVERFCTAPSSKKAVDTLMEELLEPAGEKQDSEPRQQDPTRPDGLAADKQEPDE
jgi:acetylornithine deacetylase/succinyl-diaminopimelate desuccinylase-like protein